MKNRSHKYDMSRPRHVQKYSKYKKCLSMMTYKQHLKFNL